MDFKNFRGWVVTLKDGTVMYEGKNTWREVPNRDIAMLSLLYDNRRWDLADKQAYFVKNRASMVPGISQSFRIESRSIGYYDGATKVHYTINENTGKFSMFVEGDD